jgi:hypothetical protein
LSLESVKAVDFILVATLDPGSFEIVCAFARRHEALGSDRRLDQRQKRMIAARDDDDPGTGEADHGAEDQATPAQPDAAVMPALVGGRRDESADGAGAKQYT